MMSVLMILGMLFVGCAQPGDSTSGDNNYKELTESDLVDTSILIGKFSMDIENIEYDFVSDCSTEERNEIRRNHSTDALKTLLVRIGWGGLENKTEQDAEDTANMVKILMANGSKVYINESKSKVKISPFTVTNKKYGVVRCDIKFDVIYTRQ